MSYRKIQARPTKLLGTELPVVDGPYDGDSVKYAGKRVMVRAKGSFVAGQYVLQQRATGKRAPEPRYEAYYQWFGPRMQREQKGDT